MKELLRFAMSRRFFNKANIVFNCLVLAITIIGTNLDYIINIIDPNFLNPIEITTSEQTFEEFLENYDDIVVAEGADIKIKVEEGKYIVDSESVLDTYTMNQLALTLQEYHLYYSGVTEYDMPEVVFSNIATETSSNQFSVVLAIVSGVYFMMISFVSTSASEVVYEKTTKLLEIILTSVSVRAHFFSKLIVGWLSILIQALTTGMIVLVGILIRYFSDKGTGLLKCFEKLGLTSNSESMNLDLSVLLEKDFVIQIIQIVILLMIGVVIVQMILISLSSFISNMEEASTIHSPIYISFMVLYYVWLVFNQPAQLESGFGYIGSYLPILSMLFMPSRMMLTQVSFWEVNFVILINFVFLLLVVGVGYRMYQKGILYYGSLKFWKREKHERLTRV